MSPTGRLLGRAAAVGLIVAGAAVAIGALSRHRGSSPAGGDDGRHDGDAAAAERADEAVGWIPVNGSAPGDSREPARSPVGSAAAADDSPGS